MLLCDVRSERAQERDRTADLVLTKDVLCRLSYLGLLTLEDWHHSPQAEVNGVVWKAGNGIRTRDPELGRLVL